MNSPKKKKFDLEISEDLKKVIKEAQTSSMHEDPILVLYFGSVNKDEFRLRFMFRDKATLPNSGPDAELFQVFECDDIELLILDKGLRSYLTGKSISIVDGRLTVEPEEGNPYFPWVKS